MIIVLISILFSISAFAAELVSPFPATASVTVSSSVATASVQIIGSNTGRKSIMLYNNSANSAYLTFGTTSSSSACSFILAAFSNWQWSGFATYTGPMAAIRNAGSGTIIITEFQ